ncbi:MAG: hypothetical protein HYT87_17190 [Nitrospirae bacterium]|nr:hypothetical protein [Nitrospirota bacterium]
MLLSARRLSCRRTRRLAHLAALAVLVTILSALKPITLDETAYHAAAAQIARAPLDPYGFVLFWLQSPLPANHSILPPVSNAWWALGLRILGDHVPAWKLWMFPFNFLFVLGLHGLLRRTCRGLETTLLWMTSLSPVFLPAFGLMLDVPSMALALTGLNLLMTPGQRGSVRRASLAGLFFGLAVQTKYSAFVLLGAGCLHTVLFGRIRRGVAAAVIASTLFLSWEVFTYVKYGESHFLHPILHGYPIHVEPWPHFIRPLFVFTGGLLALLAPLGFLGLGLPGWVSVALMASTALVYAVVGVFPEAAMPWATRFHIAETHFSLIRRLFAGLGMVLWGTILAGAVRGMAWDAAHRGWRAFRRASRRSEIFLFAWLAAEIVGYFALSPFPAARRFMGMAVVVTMILGRLACVRRGRGASAFLLPCAAVLQILLGLAYAGVDEMEARSHQRGVALAKDWIEQRDPAPSVWYTGHWGFQFYAERAGMQPIVPEHSMEKSYLDLPPASFIRAGDWLVIPDGSVSKQQVKLDGESGPLSRRTTLRIADRNHYRTLWCYHGGYAPLCRLGGPRLEVDVYRVDRDFTAGPP